MILRDQPSAPNSSARTPRCRHEAGHYLLWTDARAMLGVAIDPTVRVEPAPPIAMVP